MTAFAANYGPIATFLAELFGTQVRYSGLSISYMLSGPPRQRRDADHHDGPALRHGQGFLGRVVHDRLGGAIRRRARCCLPRRSSAICPRRPTRRRPKSGFPDYLFSRTIMTRTLDQALVRALRSRQLPDARPLPRTRIRRPPHSRAGCERENRRPRGDAQTRQPRCHRRESRAGGTRSRRRARHRHERGPRTRAGGRRDRVRGTHCGREGDRRRWRRD